MLLGMDARDSFVKRCYDELRPRKNPNPAPEQLVGDFSEPESRDATGPHRPRQGAGERAEERGRPMIRASNARYDKPD